MDDQQKEYSLYMGDCIEIMEQLETSSVDAIITDPPFAFTGGNSNGRSAMIDDQFFAHWWRSVCGELTRILKPEGEGFIWCDWRTSPSFAAGFIPRNQTYDVWRMPQMLYHYREMPGQGQPFRNSVDLIAYIRGPKSTGERIPNTTHNFISKYWYYGKHDNHPAEKDAEIVGQLLEWCSDPGDIVIDPFMGSGTAGIACAMTGRRFIGMEKDDGYYATATRRIEEAYLSKRGTWNAAEAISTTRSVQMFPELK